MLPAFHLEMLRLALGDLCSPRALETIAQANLRQDWLPGQIGHDEYHFDNNAFAKSYAYIEEQRARTVAYLMANDPEAAWAAFGRLTHTAQDFYAHTDYVARWLARQPKEAVPGPADIDPLDPDLINDGALRSGKVYALEALTLLPGFRLLAMRLLPRDSHAWMNLDAPAHGPNFQYAFHAARKRTKIEFERTVKDLPQGLYALFMDR